MLCFQGPIKNHRLPVRARRRDPKLVVASSSIVNRRIEKRPAKRTVAHMTAAHGGNSERQLGERKKKIERGHLKQQHGTDQILSLARRLEELDEKAGWCSKILVDLKGTSTGDYVSPALDYYRHEKESLLDMPFLTYMAIRSALDWCRRGKNGQLKDDPRTSRLKAGLMIVESGLLQQQELQDKSDSNPSSSGGSSKIGITTDLKETATKVTVARLERLLIEFLKFRKGALACPQCKSRKTHFREYTVVLDSHAMECESCGRLWKIVV